MRRCVAGVRALCGRRSAGSAISRRHCRATADGCCHLPARGHTVGLEHGSVLPALHRERSTNPRRNTSLEQLVLLLSPGRDNLVSWGKEEALG